ncbi:acetolactate synthase small subunit [Bengtsoniella intestinalis]|uniref:acetolactate synthase small subunit n=1 Tax=Bengtsoniella intestinalis TaxID=3073143 RepID=UPI00391F5F5E
MEEPKSRRVISILVDNHSGVLARVSSLFCRRDFNIEGMTASATNDPTVSRITITTYGTASNLKQLLLQTNRLEVTHQIFALESSNCLQRELLLLKIGLTPQLRRELIEICDVYNSKIIDLTPTSMVTELTGEPDKIDAFLAMFQEYDIIEMCRTGVTAIERGGRHHHTQKPPEEIREEHLFDSYLGLTD